MEEVCRLQFGLVVVPGRSGSGRRKLQAKKGEDANWIFFEWQHLVREGRQKSFGGTKKKKRRWKEVFFKEVYFARTSPLRLSLALP